MSRLFLGKLKFGLRNVCVCVCVYIYEAEE